MLKVTVAEVQRTLLKQFGINLGAAINSGNFSTKLLTENAFPLTAAAVSARCRSRKSAPVRWTSPRAHVRDVRQLCNYNQARPPAPSATPASRTSSPRATPSSPTPCERWSATA